MAEGDEGRTEAATPRRLQRAREQGQAALSREAAPAAVLAATAAVLALSAPAGARHLAVAMQSAMAHAATARPAAEVVALAAAAARAAAPFALVAAAAAALPVLAQTGLMLSPGALRPGFGRLDPRRNLGRIAGPAAWLDLARSLLKLAVGGCAVWWALAAAPPWTPEALLWEPASLPGRIARLLLRVLLAGVAAQGALAALDILRSRWAHARALRMTRQEVRDEMREADGDPQIKARIRRIRLSRARRRMLAAVRGATVVVTNPTHFAVALAYERGGGGAPRVVAKGIDAMAARIREAAEAARVPLVANPPLARALWLVELDREIPAALFQAVAEIIAYVWRLRAPRRDRP